MIDGGTAKVCLELDRSTRSAGRRWRIYDEHREAFHECLSHMRWDVAVDEAQATLAVPPTEVETVTSTTEVIASLFGKGGHK